MEINETTNTWMLFALALCGLLVGAILGSLWAQRREALRHAQLQQLEQEQSQREQAMLREQLQHQRLQAQAQQQQAMQWREDLDKARDERALWQERGSRVPLLETLIRESQQALQTAEHRISELQSQQAALETEYEMDKQNAADKLLFLEQAKESLTAQFQQLAQTILEEKSQRFSQQNQENIGQLLDPLRNRLHEFQGRVEQFYDAEGKQRAALSQQVQDLLKLNHQLNTEAQQLTQALKGSSKTQGIWGEALLERVLEQAGLREGSDYHLQQSFSLEGGKRAQPDLILHLPQNRHLVIDAKISLVAYERYARLNESTEEAAEKKAALRQHIESVRRHMRELSERNYQKLHELQSLDFVIMFVPIEPAFMLALQGDEKLSQDAWDRNVLLATPSTLLFILRTIAHLWRQEAQTRNAQEIAKRGAELYDRLAAFISDLEKIGQQLRTAQNTYDSAFTRFCQQKGNVLRQAEMLKELGIRPSKSLPAELLERAMEEEITPAAQPLEQKSDKHLPEKII